MKIGEYKQMMSFLLRPKHIHHGTKVVQGVPYVPKGYEKGGRVYRAEGDPNPDSDFNFEPGLEINQSPVSDFNPSVIPSKINPNTAIAASNKEKTQNAFYDLQKQLKRTPLINEVSNETGLSAKTVRTHLKDLDFERMPGNIVMGFYQEIGDPNVTKPTYTNQGNKWPDQQTKDDYEYQIKERKKYAKNDPELQNRFESNDLLTNEQLSEKYDIHPSTIDKINKQIVKDYDLNRPISGRSEVKKRADEKRTAAENKNTSSIVEKQLQGTKDVHLGHMSDLFNLPVNTETLGYVPQRLNSALAGKADAAIRAIIEQQNKIIENKPEDWQSNTNLNWKKKDLKTKKDVDVNFKEELERLNNLGQDYAARAGGYKVFEPINLKNLERNKAVAIDYGKTIDPTGIYEEKREPSLIKDIEPEFRKKEINKIQNVFNNVQKEKIQAAAQGREPDFSKIENMNLYNKENQDLLIKKFFFEKNINAVKENLSKIPESEIQNIKNQLKLIKKPYFKKGGRVHLAEGSDKPSLSDYLSNRVPSDYNTPNDPALNYLINKARVASSPEQLDNALIDIHEYQQEKAKNKSEGMKYLEDYPNESEYLKSPFISKNVPYYGMRALKGLEEGFEWPIGQAANLVNSTLGLDKLKLYEPFMAEPLGINSLIKKTKPNEISRKAEDVSDALEFLTSWFGPAGVSKIMKGAKSGIESLKGTEEAKDLLDPSKRNTLKVGAGVAALSPLLSELGKFKPASELAFEKAPGMPDWYGTLVNKLVKEGKPIAEDPYPYREASYKHNPKMGIGGLHTGEEKLIQHTDGDTTFILRKYPDGRTAVDIYSPRNQYEEPISLYHKPTMEFKNSYTGETIKEPSEFKVLEKKPQIFANGPDDYDIELRESHSNVKDAAGDVDSAERYATGKIKDRPIIKQRRSEVKEMEKNPTEYAADRAPEVDPNPDYGNYNE